MSSGFTAPDGGGGGGGGGGGAGGGGGGTDWRDLGILTDLFGITLGGGHREEPWKKPRVLAALLGISVDDYRRAPKEQKRAWVQQAKYAYRFQRAEQQGKPRTLERIADKLGGPVGALRRSVEFWRLSGRERKEALRSARTATRQAASRAPDRVYSQRPTTQRTPGTVSEDALLALVELVQAAREWWMQREAQKAAEREARRARRGETMALGDLLGSLGGGLTRAIEAASPIVTAIYQERAARQMARGGATGASGVPIDMLLGAGGGGSMALTGGLTSAALQALLGGQPGAMESGDVLEALESDIEREVSLWRRASGVGGRVTPVRTVLARHPQTGSIAAWEYRGKPVLYSGDLAVCKRVQKIARRSAARTGLRFRKARGR